MGCDSMLSCAEYMPQLVLTDFRFREHLFQSLKARARSDCTECARNAAFQLACCCELSIGVSRSPEATTEWLLIAGKNYDDLNNEIEHVRTLVNVKQSGEIVDYLEQDLVSTYSQRGDISTACRSYSESVQAASHHFSVSHPLVSSLRNLLAHLFRASGRYVEAEELFSSILGIEKAERGLHHPQTLAAMNQVALIWHEQGHIVESAKLGEKTLELCQRYLGPSDRYTLRTMVNLAASYLAQERARDAGTLLNEALKIYESVLGIDHPETLKALGNLSAAYLDWDPPRLHEAKEINEKVMFSRRKLDGMFHRETLVATSQWILSLKRCGEKLEVVLDFQQSVMDASVATLNKADPDRIHATLMLAKTTADLGRFPEARQLLQEALATCESHLGSSHEYHNLLLLRLAEVEKALENYDESARLLNDLMKLYGSANSLQRSSSGFLRPMYDLGHAFKDMGKMPEACSIWENLCSVAVRYPGLASSLVRKAVTCLGELYEELGDHDAAEAQFQMQLKWETEVLGDDHPETLATKNRLGSTFFAQERLQEAKRIQTEAFQSCQEVLGRENELKLALTANLAATLTALGEMEAAVVLHQCALESRSKLLGLEHEDTLSSQAQLAIHYRLTNEFPKAEALLLTVHQLRKRVLGPNDLSTLSAMAVLACIYTDQNKMVEAEDLEVSVLERRRLCLGSDHRHTLEAQANLAYTISCDPDRLSEAEALQIDLLSRLQNVVNASDPRIATAMGQLGVTYLDQKRLGEASKMFEDELKQASRIKGERGREFTLHALGHVLACTLAMGSEEESMRIEEEILRLETEKAESLDDEEDDFSAEEFYQWMTT